MGDISQLNLKEPDPVDWENYNPVSKFIPPPQAKGADGRFILYYGQAPTVFEEGATDEGLLDMLIDPIKVVKSSNGADGYAVRFTHASVKQYERNGKLSNASKLGNYLKACGITAKPQRNAEYVAATKQTAGRVFPMNLDWQARNKDTGEVVQGYDNFPEDPKRPGQKKAILHAGDVVTDRDMKGVITGKRVIESEVLFANARLKYFVDPNRK